MSEQFVSPYHAQENAPLGIGPQQSGAASFHSLEGEQRERAPSQEGAPAGGSASGALLGAGPRHPLHRQLSNPHRQVQQNAVQDALEAAARSPLLLSIALLFSVAEIAIASVCLSKGWDSPCDKPLKQWIIAYTLRMLWTVPLKLWSFRCARRAGRRGLAGRDQYDRERGEMQRYSSWSNTLTLIWIIVAHFWLYGSSSCSSDNPWVYKYVLVQLILFYVQLCIPVLLILTICLCLPCLLFGMHVFAPKPGAKPEVISRLPKRTFHPTADAGADAPSCAICMEDYKEGDQLRTLPCNHEFHVSCGSVQSNQRVAMQCLSGKPTDHLLLCSMFAL
jgi:hypothetical protein